MSRAAWAAVAAVVAVVVLVLGAGVMSGLRAGGGGADHHDERAGAAAATTSTAAPPSRPRRAPDVTVHALPARRFPTRVDVVDHLAGGDVRFVRVVGLPGGARGTAAQCVLDDAGPAACGPAVPASADGGGRAEFLFEFAADVAGPGPGPGRAADCTADAAPCALVVEAGGRTAVARTVFGGPAPPPARVTATPAEGVRSGDDVTVTLSGFPPSARAVVTQCVPSARLGTAACGGPAPTVPVVVGDDGRATVRYRVQAGPVGASGECRRGRPCAVGVVGPGLLARAAAAPITFAGRPPARYDGRRVVTGLLGAAVFLAGAAWLVRRTDWSPVGDLAPPGAL